MIEIIKRNVVALVAALTLVVVPMVGVGVVKAAPNPPEKVCSGVNSLDTTTNSNCGTSALQGSTGINALITNIVNVFSIIVGIVAVIMIIFGGFKYITSGGSSEGVSSAKNTILYAIVGLIIVALAQIIVQFVVGRATNP